MLGLLPGIVSPSLKSVHRSRLSFHIFFVVIEEVSALGWTMSGCFFGGRSRTRFSRNKI